MGLCQHILKLLKPCNSKNHKLSVQVENNGNNRQWNNIQNQITLSHTVSPLKRCQRSQRETMTHDHSKY